VVVEGVVEGVDVKASVPKAPRAASAAKNTKNTVDLAIFSLLSAGCAEIAPQGKPEGVSFEGLEARFKVCAW
jgi:hypothetical protein